MSSKPTAGAPLPELDLPLAGGGEVHLGGPRDGWQMVVVYRGRHCPMCKKYLGRLQEMAGDFAATGVDVVTVSGDGQQKAEDAKAEWGLDLPVAYGLSVSQMQDWGLYISDPRSTQETDRPFPEPGLFLVRPDGNLQIADIANAPFARPNLEYMLGGIKVIQEKDYPVRGTHQ